MRASDVYGKLDGAARDLHTPGGSSAARRLSPKRYHLEGFLASFSFGSLCGDAHLPALIKFHQRGATWIFFFNVLDDINYVRNQGWQGEGGSNRRRAGRRGLYNEV